MAIIERKQLTGSTAKINQYAGHEGQLVFDKTTKHLHVLSGTAGKSTKIANVSDIPAPVDISGKADKTYVDTGLAGKANSSHTHTSVQITDLNTTISNALRPYATQEYTDNKVSHLEGKVDTSNAAITEALNKKENAGVCLPLTGGTMLGDILFKTPNGGFSIGGLTEGASLALNEATKENYEGQVILQASDGTTATYCNLYPNGELRLDGCVVDCITHQSDGVVRYASGLQIGWFSSPIATTKGEVLSWSLTYPLPFAEGRPLSVSINSLGGWAYSTIVQLESIGLASCNGTLRRAEGEGTNVLTIYGIVIGYWK